MMPKRRPLQVLSSAAGAGERRWVPAVDMRLAREQSEYGEGDQLHDEDERLIDAALAVLVPALQRAPIVVAAPRKGSEPAGHAAEAVLASCRPTLERLPAQTRYTMHRSRNSSQFPHAALPRLNSITIGCDGAPPV
jgi:hypothetical protein